MYYRIVHYIRLYHVVHGPRGRTKTANYCCPFQFAKHKMYHSYIKHIADVYFSVEIRNNNNNLQNIVLLYANVEIYKSTLK